MKEISKTELDNENFEIFKFNPLYSFPFYLSIVFILIPFLSLFNPNQTYRPFLVSEGVALVIFAVSSYSHNYFLVSPKYLVVNNYFKIWPTKIFVVKDIKQVMVFSFKFGLTINLLMADNTTKRIPTNAIFERQAKGIEDKLNEYLKDK